MHHNDLVLLRPGESHTEVWTQKDRNADEEHWFNLCERIRTLQLVSLFVEWQVTVEPLPEFHDGLRLL
jgi:hypothetical protein